MKPTTQGCRDHRPPRIYSRYSPSTVVASRRRPLNNNYPLWSAAVVIDFIDAQTALAALGGTRLVVAGLILIALKPDRAPCQYRWWQVLYSLAAVFLAVQFTGKIILDRRAGK